MPKAILRVSTATSRARFKRVPTRTKSFFLSEGELTAEMDARATRCAGRSPCLQMTPMYSPCMVVVYA